MKNFPSTLTRLVAVFSATLALGACSRADYATLPRTAAYLNSATAVAKPRPAAPVIATASPVALAPVAEVPVAPAPEMAAAPVSTAAATKAPTVAAAAQPAQAATATLATAPAPRLNLVQRLALKKITKKLDKLTANVPQLRQHDATAARGGSGISGNLRTGLIILIIGALVAIFNGVIGGIIALIGLVFILLWLLDQA